MPLMHHCLCGLAALLVAGAAKTPLADAVQQRDARAVRALFAEGADVNAPQSDGMTALHWAVHHDDLETTRALLDAGANANAQNRYRITPLSLACTNGHAQIVERLLTAGADPNATLPGGETALMTAARTGRLGPVQALLARGAKVDARENKGQTALMWAAAEGHADVVDALLEAGADFRIALRSGFTALFFAVREGRTDVVLRLLKAGADVNAAMDADRASAAKPLKNTNPLILAVENGHFELAASLLAAGANPNERPAGYTALHAMAWVRKPIRGDGDPPPTGSGKLSSLDFVRQLVASGADLDARLEKGESGRGRFTTTGSTPFLLAARACDLPLMNLLLELGANPQLPNADGSTPLLAAAGVGALGDGDEAAGTPAEAVESVRLLLKLGADVNAVDQNGETAMHGAAYQDRPELVRLLADNGADANVWHRENKWSWTPLHIAEGHRPGNFRPAPATIAAIHEVLRASGITPPPPRPRTPVRQAYEK
jgi:ankyrin repeat protein